jgi:hypothetical protein
VIPPRIVIMRESREGGQEAEMSAESRNRGIHHLHQIVTVAGDIITTKRESTVVLHLHHRSRRSLTDIKAATKAVSIIIRSTRSIIIRDLIPLILPINPLLLDPLPKLPHRL